MPLADTLLAEFERETTLTRRVMVRIPDDRFDWRPHPKSTTMGGLARHLAHMITWATAGLTTSEFDLSTRAPMPPTASIADVLSIFDANVTATRDLIKNRADDDLTARWVLTGGGRIYVTTSKALVVSDMVVHHMIHHRGQLSVYLRLNDIAVPSIYGPTADEPM